MQQFHNILTFQHVVQLVAWLAVRLVHNKSQYWSSGCDQVRVWLTCGHVKALELDRQQVVDHRRQVRVDVGGCAWIRVRHYNIIVVGNHNTLLAQRDLIVLQTSLLYATQATNFIRLRGPQRHALFLTGNVFSLRCIVVFLLHNFNEIRSASDSFTFFLWQWFLMGADTQSRNLYKKLAQCSCASFLHQIFVQVHVRSCTRNFHNKYGRQS